MTNNDEPSPAILLIHLRALLAAIIREASHRNVPEILDLARKADDLAALLAEE